MVQDIRTEKVFEELAMTGAQSESALWSILGFYFSIIFGLLAVLILLKTVKLGSLLDFSSKDCLTEATESHEEGKQSVPTSQSNAKSPAGGKKTSENKYARPPKNLTGSTQDAVPAKARTPTKQAKNVIPSSVPTAALSPVRVSAATANRVESSSPSVSNKRKPEAPSTGRKKAKKDPNAPKKPLSAYLMFQNDKRAELSKLHPEMSSNEISALASQMWKNELTEQQKKPYIEKEAALREQYKKDAIMFRAKKEAEGSMDVEETSNQSVEKKGEKSPRKAKDPDAPKHPRAGFVVFNSNVEIRKALKEQFPEASPQDLMRLLGAQWAAMKPDEKDKYEEVAKQERTIYKAEKEAYGKKKASEQGSSLANTTPNSLNETEGPMIGGPVSNFTKTGDAASTTNETPAESVKDAKKSSSLKTVSPMKAKSPKKKVSPVRKKTPSKVPILSSKRALRSVQRKTRSTAP